MGKILVGFSGNEASKDAIQLAASWAKFDHSEMIVVAAFPLGTTGRYSDVREDFSRETREAAEEAAGHPFEFRVVVGASPARALTEMAEEEGVDLVVVGSTRRGPIGSVLPGSVADRLLEGSPCSVLIAPNGYAKSYGASLKQIGVGFNGSPESWLAVEETKRLAGSFGARVTLITGYRPAVIASPSDVQTMIREGLEQEMARAEEFINDGIVTMRVLEQVLPAELLIEQSSHLDLLVLGSRGYGPFRRTLRGSVSSTVVKKAHCPVLVVPRGAGR